MDEPTLIRLAGLADADGLARMRWEFRAALNRPSETEEQFVARCRAWMTERLGASSQWRCWVAQQRGMLAGHLWLQIIEKIPNPAPELEFHAYITNVYVRPAAREHGIGAMLVEAALAWCRGHAIDSVVLWPTPRSRSLYARHGFREPDDLLEAVLDRGRDLAQGGQ